MLLNVDEGTHQGCSCRVQHHNCLSYLELVAKMLGWWQCFLQYFCSGGCSDTLRSERAPAALLLLLSCSPLSLPPLLRPTSSLPFKRHGTLSPLLENKLSRSTARPEPSRLAPSTSVLFRRLTLTFVRPVRDSASLPSAVSESAPAARILENRTRT